MGRRGGEEGEKEGTGERKGKDPLCVPLAPFSEQNADRKCRCRNDSLHRRQTPTASPFPPLLSSHSLNQCCFRCCYCSAPRRSPPSSAAAGVDLFASPRRSGYNQGSATWLPHPFGCCLSLSPPPPPVCGRRLEFTLRPALKGRQPVICNEVTIEKSMCFGLYFCLP